MNIKERFQRLSGKSLDSRLERRKSRRRKTYSSSWDMDTEPRPGTAQNVASMSNLGSRLVSEIEEEPRLTTVRNLQSPQNWEADFDSLTASPRGMTRASSPLQRGRGGSNDSSLTALSGKSEDRAGSIGSAGLLRLGGRKGWTASRWQVGSEKPQTMMPETSGPIQFPPQQQLDPRDLQRCYSTPQLSGATAPKTAGEPSVPTTSSGIPEAMESEDGRQARSNGMRLDTQGSNRAPQSGKSNLSKEWINMELDRLKSEYQFKSQIATMLRTTLAGMKTQRSRRLSHNSPNGFSGPALPTHIMPDQEIVHPRPEQLPMDGAPAGMKPQWSPPQSPMHSHAPVSPREFSALKSELQSRKKEVSNLESDIAALEAHVKLLSDALDDERQDNQDLSLENSMLKAQVEKLTAAGERLLEGMTKMRGGQE
ncbi:hypothetical protein BSKO_04217 [Bryopsis sp. KO-2023]|nr:hypothetical protein BSKO_04217 [Bryopsis sp. KO-2023]